MNMMRSGEQNRHDAVRKKGDSRPRLLFLSPIELRCASLVQRLGMLATQTCRQGTSPGFHGTTGMCCCVSRVSILPGNHTVKGVDRIDKVDSRAQLGT